MRYPVKIEKVDGEFIATVSHPNGRFQGACAGKTKDEAQEEVSKLLAAIIASAIKDGEDIPAPETCNKGNTWAILPPLLSAKAAIYSEMRKTGKRKADMARALNMNQKQVDRIIDPAHRSTLLQLEAAAATLGKHLEMRLF